MQFWGVEEKTFKAPYRSPVRHPPPGTSERIVCIRSKIQVLKEQLVGTKFLHLDTSRSADNARSYILDYRHKGHRQQIIIANHPIEIDDSQKPNQTVI